MLESVDKDGMKMYLIFTLVISKNSFSRTDSHPPNVFCVLFQFKLLFQHRHLSSSC